MVHTNRKKVKNFFAESCFLYSSMKKSSQIKHTKNGKLENKFSIIQQLSLNVTYFSRNNASYV